MTAAAVETENPHKTAQATLAARTANREWAERYLRRMKQLEAAARADVEAARRSGR